jgi:hypothetical protein
MQEKLKDTSKDYDDLVGYKSNKFTPTDLSEFLGESDNKEKPKVKPKPTDSEFPESWQTIIMNFRSEEDYIEFMKLIDNAPVPKLSTLVYSKKENKGVLDFLGD